MLSLGRERRHLDKVVDPDGNIRGGKARVPSDDGAVSPTSGGVGVLYYVGPATKLTEAITLLGSRLGRSNVLSLTPRRPAAPLQVLHAAGPPAASSGEPPALGSGGAGAAA
jgi:hypothetical protein